MERSPADDIPETSPHLTAPRSFWKRTGMVLVNVWLVYHLFAIVMAPASVGPSSGLEYAGWQAASPYLQTLNLNHGYHFFAPDPGGSALVSYVLEYPDGRSETGRFPNREIFPRLLYHRHFMLSEYLANSDPRQHAVICRSYARNLCRRTGASKVTLSLVSHGLASRDQVLQGVSLDHPESYSEEPLGTFVAEEL